MEEKKHCKWYNDEFCTNDKSPCVADYCPVVEYPELCKFREVAEDINVPNKTELSDEEIVKALECCTGLGRCTKCPYFIKGIDCVNNQRSEKDYLDLIHRLKSEKGALENELINECKEHEQFAEMVKKVDAEQKAEIERLTRDKNDIMQSYQDLAPTLIEDGEKIEELEKDKEELQKQVDELTEENNHFFLQMTTLEGIMDAKIEQAVKDTAKEIYGEIDDSDILVVETQEYGEIEVVPMERLKEIIKSKGVEVE